MGNYRFWLALLLWPFVATATDRFVCVDNGANRLLLVDRIDAKRGWSVEIPAGSRDLQRFGTNDVLVSHGTGCGIYRLSDGSIHWRIEGFPGIQTARFRAERDELVLAGGAQGVVTFHTLVRSGDWFASTGRAQRVTAADPASFRFARYTPDGHVLFTAGNPYRIVEWDLEAGKRSWSAPLPGKGYMAVRQPDGTTLATTGGEVSLVEIGRDGRVLRTWLGEAYRKKYRLNWLSGFEVRPDGHYVIANWLGHGAHGTGPHVIEIDRDGQLVWSWEDHAAAQQITNILCLDEPPR